MRVVETLSGRKDHGATAAGPWFGLEPLESRVLLDGSPGGQAIELFGASPAVFVQNQGQWADDAARYAFQGDGANVVFTDAGLIFQVFGQEPGADADIPAETDDVFGLPDNRIAAEEAAMRSVEFSVGFDGAEQVGPVGLDQSQSVFNYFIGDQAGWRSGVAAYETISYPNLYAGIDLYTWGRRDSLKYEFHVAPGADYREIQVSYDGIEGLWLAPDGVLHVETELGELIDEAPYIYQDIDGERIDVAGAFQLIDADTYAFDVTGQYDPAAELIIDPYMVWSTYLGGSGWDEGGAIAVDSLDNVLVGGFTKSPGWGSGGLDTTFNGAWDAFAVKISPSGEHLWSTYIGGAGYDWANAIAVDSADNVLVAGYTESSGWASGGFDTTYRGDDGFVVKITPSGEHIWSTYLGGNRTDSCSDVAVDSLDNVLVAGYTESSGWVSGGFDRTRNGNYDAFAAKMSASGEHIWSTYLGGNDADFGTAVAVDSQDNVLVAGHTESSGWVSGGFDTTLSGSSDALVARISPSGEHIWSTYIGGSRSDRANVIAVDSLDNVLVAGETSSSGWVSGGFDTTFNWGTDAFAAKLSASGAHLWSTYLGGTGDSQDRGRGIAVDSVDSVLVSGLTPSPDWVSGGFNTTLSGWDDGFLVKISPSGEHIWSTYLGGSGSDGAGGVAVDSLDNIFVAGSTESAGWVSGGFDTTYNGGGNGDGFVVKICQGSPTLGDASGDGVVNDDDLSLLLANWTGVGGVGKTWGQGDFDGNGAVTDSDLSLLLANWTGVGSAGAAVTEPVQPAIRREEDQTQVTEPDSPTGPAPVAMIDLSVDALMAVSPQLTSLAPAPLPAESLSAAAILTAAPPPPDDTNNDESSLALLAADALA